MTLTAPDKSELETVDVSQETVQALLDDLLARCYADGRYDTPDYTERTKESAYALLKIVEALRTALTAAQAQAQAQRDVSNHPTANTVTAHNAPRKVKRGPGPQLDSLDLAEIRARYVGSRLPAETAADMEALWLEVDRLRFELAGANERTRIAREERERAEGLYWRLQMSLKGGPV